MTGMSKLPAFSFSGQQLKDVHDGNVDIANSMKRVLVTQNNVSQFVAVAVGSVQSINYGTPTVLETDYLTFDGVTATFVTPGIYFAAVKLQAARVSSQQVSNIATRTVFTPSGGSVEYSSPRYTELQNTDDSRGLTRSALILAGAGDAYSGEFVKDSGHINVELEAITLATPGWGTSPSASLTIWKLNENGTGGILEF